MKQKQVKAKLKVYLLLGKSISHNQAQKRWHTNRLASYIHRLKKEMHEIGFEIVCTVVHGKGREQYGVYSLRRLSNYKIKPKEVHKHSDKTFFPIIVPIP